MSKTHDEIVDFISGLDLIPLADLGVFGKDLGDGFTVSKWGHGCGLTCKSKTAQINGYYAYPSMALFLLLHKFWKVKGSNLSLTPSDDLCLVYKGLFPEEYLRLSSQSPGETVAEMGIYGNGSYKDYCMVELLEEGLKTDWGRLDVQPNG